MHGDHKWKTNRTSKNIEILKLLYKKNRLQRKNAFWSAHSNLHTINIALESVSKISLVLQIHYSNTIDVPKSGSLNSALLVMSSIFHCYCVLKIKKKKMKMIKLMYVYQSSTIQSIVKTKQKRKQNIILVIGHFIPMCIWLLCST